MCDTCPCQGCDQDITKIDPCIQCSAKLEHQKKWKYESCDNACPQDIRCDHDCQHCTRYQLGLCSGEDDEEDTENEDDV